MLQSLDKIVVGPDADPGIWTASAGQVIFQVMIHTRAVPWKAPKNSRSGAVTLKFQLKSYQHWKNWSEQMKMLLAWAWMVRSQALDCFDGSYEGPVDLDMLFVIAPGGNPPDRINCGKSMEDLLEGIAYKNDRVVRGGDVRRVFIGDPVGYPAEGSRWDGPERIYIRLTSAG